MKFFSFIIVAAFGVLGVVAQLPHCPEKYGEQAYAHPEICDQFFLCVNGTLSLEQCGNGLIFTGKGAAHHHCAYNWNHEVDCGTRAYDPTPSNNGVCVYDFGLYEDNAGGCSTSYIKCEEGYPHQLPCEKGLVYDDRIHGCNWPDLVLEKCNPEAVVGFKCPAKVTGPAARFWPFPRFAVPGDPHGLFLCNEGHPRYIACGEGKFFDESTLTCEDA